MQNIIINGRLVDYSSLEIEGIFRDDAPEFGEAYWSYGEFMDGSPLSELELYQVLDEFPVPYDEIVNRLI
jgi:hypothetical protein